MKSIALLVLAPTLCLAQFVPTTYNVNVRMVGGLDQPMRPLYSNFDGHVNNAETMAAQQLADAQAQQAWAQAQALQIGAQQQQQQIQRQQAFRSELAIAAQNPSSQAYTQLMLKYPEFGEALKPGIEQLRAQENVAFQNEASRRQMAREAAETRPAAHVDPSYSTIGDLKVIINRRAETGVFHRAGCKLISKPSDEIALRSAEIAHLKPCEVCSESARTAASSEHIPTSKTRTKFGSLRPPAEASHKLAAASKPVKTKTVYVDFSDEDPMFHRAGCKLLKKGAAPVSLRAVVKHAKSCEECF